MQCRKIFIMADLRGKHYTVISLVNALRLSPSIRKIYFIRQNAIIVKKQISCSHIESSSLPNEAFSQLISTKSLQITLRGRSSRSQMIMKIKQLGSLKDFVIHRKTPVLESLFNNTAGLEVCNFIKKRLQRRGFPVKMANLRTALEHLWWLLLKRSYLTPLEKFCI